MPDAQSSINPKTLKSRASPAAAAELTETVSHVVSLMRAESRRPSSERKRPLHRQANLKWHRRPQRFGRRNPKVVLRRVFRLRAVAKTRMATARDGTLRGRQNLSCRNIPDISLLYTTHLVMVVHFATCHNRLRLSLTADRLEQDNKLRVEYGKQDFSSCCLGFSYHTRFLGCH